MGGNVVWVRYVDDVLVVAPSDMDLNVKLDELNAVDPKIQFTIEHEKQGRIPFLDTEIERTGDCLKFKVYRKPTNKEDYIHFYSGHSDRVKRGVVLGFFLRAYRICSEEYLEQEIQHVLDSFIRLKFPKGLLLNLKRKAMEIRNRAETERQRKKNERYLTIPNSKLANVVAKRIETTGARTAVTSGRKIGEMIRKKEKKDKSDKSVVYRVPCGICEKAYIGETGRGAKTRLKEHKRDFRNFMEHSAFVAHANKTGHLPNWEGTEIIASCSSKAIRKATEAAYIATNETINTNGGFIKWAKSAAQLSIIDLDKN